MAYDGGRMKPESLRETKFDSCKTCVFRKLDMTSTSTSTFWHCGKHDFDIGMIPEKFVCDDFVGKNFVSKTGIADSNFENN